MGSLSNECGWERKQVAGLQQASPMSLEQPLEADGVKDILSSALQCRKKILTALGAYFPQCVPWTSKEVNQSINHHFIIKQIGEFLAQS